MVVAFTVHVAFQCILSWAKGNAAVKLVPVATQRFVAYRATFRFCGNSISDEKTIGLMSCGGNAASTRSDPPRRFKLDSRRVPEAKATTGSIALNK